MWVVCSCLHEKSSELILQRPCPVTVNVVFIFITGMVYLEHRFSQTQMLNNGSTCYVDKCSYV